MAPSRPPAPPAPPPPASSASARRPNPNGPHAHSGIEGMHWSTTPVPVLHSYRHAFNLSTSSASSSFYNNLVLSTPMGAKTPSRVEKRRVEKEVLARAVRKDFNAMPINESEVIVRFLYSVKMQERKWRLRFPPEGARREGKEGAGKGEAAGAKSREG